MDKAASISGPTAVDLRALVMAGVAVSPLDLWSLVDSVNWLVDARLARLDIVLVTIFRAIDLFLTSVGKVAVVLGCALLLRRGRVRPFSFTLTSLAVAVPFVVVDAITFVPTLREQEAAGPTDVGSSYYVVAEILRYSVTFGAVALAARLYASWSAATVDALGARRCAALGAVVVLLALAMTVSWASPWLGADDESYSPPVVVLYLLRYFLWSLVMMAGPVFLFGLVAIGAVQRLQRERSIGALVIAGLGAALAFGAFYYGRGLVRGVLFDPSLAWWKDTVIDYAPLITAAVAGFVGAIIYAVAIDGAAFGARLRALPSTILNMRNRPLYAPDEDVER
jgi:hypothetical protein